MKKILFLVFVFLTTIQTSHATDTLLRAQLYEEELFQIVETFLERKSNAERLVEALAFLKNNAVLAVPAAERPLPLQATNQNSILLIFLSEKDSKMSLEWEEIYMMSEMAQFFPDIGTLVVNADKINGLESTEMALAILQKAYEASIFNENGRRIENGEAYQKTQGKVTNFVTQALYGVK